MPETAARVILRLGSHSEKEYVEKTIKHFDGVISRTEDHTVTVELTGGKQVTFPVDQVDRANLKFEW